MSDGIRMGVCGEGYPTIHGPLGERIRVHRLVAVAEYGPRDVVTHDVHHIDGCPSNNAPENLSLRQPWEHRSENLREASA